MKRSIFCLLLCFAIITIWFIDSNAYQPLHANEAPHIPQDYLDKTTSPIELLPVQSSPSQDEDIVQLALSNWYACALTNVGTVYCWGAGSSGDIKNNKYVYPLSGLEGTIVTIAAGYGHTCALAETGGIKCWGNNYSGQLGDGTDEFNSREAVDVVGLTSGVAAIAMGGASSCALLDDGTVQCWGSNDSGQLGNGTTEDSNTPTNVVGLPANIKAISVGVDHACAIDGNNEVLCWGSNEYGQLGIGTTTDRNTPVRVADIVTDGMHISVGNSHTCAITADGGFSCWGSNETGELGDGTTTEKLIPSASLSVGEPLVEIVASGNGGWDRAHTHIRQLKDYFCFTATLD